MITDKERAENHFLPDIRKMQRLIAWAYDEDKYSFLDAMTDGTLEKLIRNLGPSYHAVESLESDCYPTVGQFRAVLKQFWQEKLTVRRKAHPTASYFYDKYSDEELQELIRALEPLFHKDLNDERLYMGLDYYYLWQVMEYPEEWITSRYGRFPWSRW